MTRSASPDCHTKRDDYVLMYFRAIGAFLSEKSGFFLAEEEEELAAIDLEARVVAESGDDLKSWAMRRHLEEERAKAEDESTEKERRTAAPIPMRPQVTTREEDEYVDADDYRTQSPEGTSPRGTSAVGDESEDEEEKGEESSGHEASAAMFGRSRKSKIRSAASATSCAASSSRSR